MSIVKKAKWVLLSCFNGCGVQFGEGSKTDFVLVGKPEVFKELNPAIAHKVTSFPGLVAEIMTNIGSWKRYLGHKIPAIHGDSVALVLGTWGGAINPHLTLKDINQKFDQVFFKPHPHDGCAWLDEDVCVLEEPWVPAEAYILMLSSILENLVVFHYSSSALFYCGEALKNVEFVDLLCDKHVHLVCSKVKVG